MPELPEVETIKTDLQKLLTGRTISKIQIKDPAVLTGISPAGKERRKTTIEEFQKKVIGNQIARFLRRGKYLVMEFLNRSSLIFHLRMTGQLLVQPPLGKERAIFFFKHGDPLCFIDRRRFGEIVYSLDWKKNPSLNALGVDPFNGKMTASFLKDSFKNRSASIHSLLLNQNIVCGLGNIYANEALFRAGIRPQRTAKKIPLPELKKLSTAIKEVLQNSISNRGYSMSTYVDALGKKGRSQLFTVVYGKEGLPCIQCRKPLVRRVISGRGTTYCPWCQS